MKRFAIIATAAVSVVVVLLVLLKVSNNALARVPLDARDTLAGRNGIRNSPLTAPVDSIVVVKKERHMYVFCKQKLLKAYHIALGTSPVGPKHFKDDRKTPEGLYYLKGRNPNSIAHKSIGISYPNDNDREYARRFGKPTGGDVKIHGLLNGEEANKDAWMNHDWTWGCIAITNEELDELYAHVEDGVPINILP